MLYFYLLIAPAWHIESTVAQGLPSHLLLDKNQQLTRAQVNPLCYKPLHGETQGKFPYQENN